MFGKLSKKSLATSVFAFALLIGASAQAEIIEEKKISGWIVTYLKTENSGLSCQARRCNKKNCGDPKTVASMNLWGSARRKAITPMVGANFANAGIKNAKLVVGELEFDAVQPNTDSIRYMTKNQSDDIVLLRAMVANQKKGSISLVTKAGTATFRLKGLDRVLAYFEKTCGIPRP